MRGVLSWCVLALSFGYAVFTVGKIDGEITAFAQDKAAAEEKAKPPYIPSEVQKLKLENAQLRAGIAQRDLTAAQHAWNAAAGEFRAACDAIKKENSWPEDVTCDLQTLKVTEPPPKPAAPEKDKPQP